jgi:UDPglucose 6-dehydrogenase
VILTEWNEFRALDLKKIVETMNTPRFADLRNVYATKDVERAGFEAYSAINQPNLIFKLYSADSDIAPNFYPA